MATLWDIITSNSTLPVQAGNTFWDHMNNQNTGSGSGIDRTFHTPFKSSIQENMSSKIKQTLLSNVSGNGLNSSIKTFIESQVST